MIIRSWLEAEVDVTHGNLVERVMLTKAVPQDSNKPGAILNHLISLSRAILEAGCSTFKTAHTNMQEVIYVVRGRGSVSVESRRRPIRDGDVILIPPNSSHILVNDENAPMEVLITMGDVPANRREAAANKFVVRNWRESSITKSHWNHDVRQLLQQESDGLANIAQAIIVEIQGMKVCEPHDHPPNGDELWYLLEGEVLHWVGQEVRLQRPGTVVPAYPSECAHGQINPSDAPAKFFYIARYGSR